MTDASNAPPSRNPANYDALSGALDVVLTKFLQGTDDMLPAVVLAYNRTTNLALVQPLINMVTTLNQIVPRNQVTIPVLQLGGGGFVLSFPLVNGNLGWIKANDRDISIFKQSLSQSSPNTNRKHSFSDAVFIPDTMMKAVTIASEDALNAVFQNSAGTVKVALWANQLKVLAPNSTVTDEAGYTATAGAVLDVQSTTKAFKIPRMTHAQRNAIPSPEGGMMVYVTDTPTGFSSYTDGVGWS